jgi:hypothetical protein
MAICVVGKKPTLLGKGNHWRGTGRTDAYLKEARKLWIATLPIDRTKPRQADGESRDNRDESRVKGAQTTVFIVRGWGDKMDMTGSGKCRTQNTEKERRSECKVYPSGFTLLGLH